MILLTTERRFKPPVVVDREDGSWAKNDTLGDDEAIIVSYTIATPREKQVYQESYSLQTPEGVRSQTMYHKEAAIEKHVTSISGLEKYKIVNGKTLNEFPANETLNDVIDFTFWRIIGINLGGDRETSPKEDFLPGESTVSD